MLYSESRTFLVSPSAIEEVQKELAESTARAAELAKGTFHPMGCPAQYRNREEVGWEGLTTAGGLAGHWSRGFIPLFSLLFITIFIISDFISVTKLLLSQPMGFTLIFSPSSAPHCTKEREGVAVWYLVSGWGCTATHSVDTGS